MKHTELGKSAPAHPGQGGPSVAESRVPQEDKAAIQSEHQQFKGVRGDQGLVQPYKGASIAQTAADRQDYVDKVDQSGGVKPANLDPDAGNPLANPQPKGSKGGPT